MFINLVTYQKVSRYYQSDYSLLENMLGFIQAALFNAASLSKDAIIVSPNLPHKKDENILINLDEHASIGNH